MGTAGSKRLIVPEEVKNAGCLKIVFNKYGPEAVDWHQLQKWHRWTEGKFPLSGTLSSACLKECREMMIRKVRPYKIEMFEL